MSPDSPASLQAEVAEAAETIVAISTPPGRGGIGIVRLSGPSALALVPHLVSVQAPLTHARAQFGLVLDPHRAAPVSESTEDKNSDQSANPIGLSLNNNSSTGVLSIDDAIVTTFHGPHSYTGEDVVEI